MKIEMLEATYHCKNNNVSPKEKRGFRSVNKTKYVDGTEVRLRRLSHEVHERIVVGYDRVGRPVYGTFIPQRTFDVRDSKEREVNGTAPTQDLLQLAIE